jgi:L-methionine (R)-S-oxide reductase
MSESLIITQHGKEEKYKELLPQIKSLLDGEKDMVANMANTIAALKESFGFFWVGFYTVKENTLVLSPFQGPIACTRISFGKGVCGTAWKEKQTLIVPDVDKFQGHIACSSSSRSEIVVPLMHDNTVIGVLDIDSDQLNAFDETDRIYLEKIVQYI